jgi:S1-C subfamily serine protease
MDKVKKRSIKPIFALSGDLPDPLVRVSPVMQRKWRQLPKCVGSSFYIGSFGKSALFVTARHVLKDIEGKPAEAFVLLPTYPVEATGQPNGLTSLNVTKICGSEPLSDAAILVAEIPSALPPQPFIDTDCPKAGDRCAALGYSEMITTINGDLGWADTKPKLEFNFRLCRGVVEQAFPRRRDISLIKFPCFQFDTIDRPGMSGGPVVNNEGSIIGIVSSGYDTGPSYAVLIAMIAELKVEVLGDNGAEEVSVAELIGQREIFNKASMNFTIKGQDESTVVTWRENF